MIPDPERSSGINLDWARKNLKTALTNFADMERTTISVREDERRYREQPRYKPKLERV